jgi:acetylglutamate kinase
MPGPHENDFRSILFFFFLFISSLVASHFVSSISFKPRQNPSSVSFRTASVVTSALTEVPLSAQSAAFNRVDVISESLPFIQRFRGKTVVVKYGGAAMKSPQLRESVIKDMVLLSCVGLRMMLVHGGGPEINSWLARIGVQPQFINGLRVTDALTMEVVEMVLVGKVFLTFMAFISLLFYF